MEFRLGFRIALVWFVLALTLSGEGVEAQRAGCKNVHYDLAFIIDTSSSVGKENFEKIRQWVANLVESFDIAPDKTRVAVVRYSDKPTTEFTLGRYRTLEDVKQAARNIRYLGGNTMTGDAINYTTDNIFTESSGARPLARGIQKVAILLTDGRSQDYVLEPSRLAAKAGIRMFAVGIGEALKEELEEIAAEPKNAHVFHVTDFNAIDKIRGRLRRRLCENVLCPKMKVQPDRFKPNSTSYGLEEVPGFDLMKYFNVKDILGARLDEGQSSYVRLGTMPIVQQTEDVFPQGLPDEYAFVTTFKFRKTSRREDWYLWQIFDKYGIPQVSIRLDGENKAVEYNAVGLTKDAVRSVFKNPEVDNLFDRNWHKIALSVDAKSVALYLDCKHIQTLPIEDREDIDIQGRTVIGKRLYDSVPIDFDLQRMMIYCDSKHAELETCCDLPNGPCPKKVVTEAPPIWIPTPTPTVAEQKKGPEANCSCPPGTKGTGGVPGIDGLTGDKGDKGEAGRPGAAGLPGPSGQKGIQGDAGTPGSPGPKGVVGDSGVKGEKGNPGAGVS
ncbi:collagen alpha-1(XXII) chain-like isoform X2 [Cyprinodon tularosa]|uniref:collagen alpha-1(XXII) chain-like isoform X2 n=1 Tax=Cyprinodon tularosa TaxID=77115 RepID=UPI0018E27F9D|nr:collagen alpha-1(XXII) chain-like isoform X2 [Cyprinodon tularosa]